MLMMKKRVVHSWEENTPSYSHRDSRIQYSVFNLEALSLVNFNAPALDRQIMID